MTDNTINNEVTMSGAGATLLAGRGGNWPGYRNYFLGFRLACSLS